MNKVRSCEQHPTATFYKFIDNNMYDMHWGSVEDSKTFMHLYQD